MNENEIKIVPDFDAEKFPQMAHIRFDCIVTMFDHEKVKTNGSFFGIRKIPRKPNWLKSESTMTLEFIKSNSEFEIGRKIKQQFQQLEQHIEMLYKLR
jgi:hypothetical protein